MPNPYFSFKLFTIHHDRCAMKVTTDGCLFGAWLAAQVKSLNITRALDIGTGTGVLSLMVAQQNAVQLTAVELDAAAAGQARENVAASPWPEQIQVIQADILTWESAFQFPVIFSNPPYYESELASPNKVRSMAHHGAGLLLGNLLAKANSLLEPGGSFYLMLPSKRENDLIRLCKEGGWHLRQKVVVRPSAAHAPFRMLLQLDRQGGGGVPTVADLNIRDDEQHYSAAFSALLKDYYLYL